MTRRLLAVSIGPVQEFIAAARKTRDLWYGSELLSQVARAGALALQEHAHAELIFPHSAALEDGSRAAVANKLLAILPDGSAPEAAVDAVRAAATAVLLEAWRAALQRLSRRPAASGAIDEASADRQIRTLLEIQAAWAPLAPGDADYKPQRERVDRLLAGRKALRDFEPPPSSYGQPMSSLDPARACVVQPWVYADERSRDANRAAAARQALGIKRGERLDGVSLLKRLAEPKRFVSVSRVAADPWVRRAASTDGMRLGLLADLAEKLLSSHAVERLPLGAGAGLSQYAAFPYDLELFYDDGRTDDRLLDEPYKRLAGQFFEQVRRVGLGEVPPYYTVLVADGDRMGKLISAIPTRELHVRLSDALVTFAKHASSIVAEHHGALVYAGGDDVLALLPLDTAIRCANALRQAFAAALAPVCAEVRAGGDATPPPTLSVGLAIAHYNEPFSEVLEWARAAEQHAKGWRNSLAVALHTRSGGGAATTVRHRWDEEPQDLWTSWVGWHLEGALPDGAAYELRDLLAGLRQLSPTDRDAVLPREVRRVLERKRARGGASVADAIVSVIAGPVAAPRADDGTGPHALRPADRLARIVDGLIVAQRLADVAALTAAAPAHSREASA